MATLMELVSKGSQHSSKPVVAVAAACDAEVLEAIQLAIKHNLASFQLFDDETKLKELMKESFPALIKHEDVSLHHAKNDQMASLSAVKSVHLNEASVLMKGHVATSTILKAVLNPDVGLRTGKVLSHVAAFQFDHYDRLIFLTDAAMNIAPDLSQKAQIIQNAVKVARATGVDRPIVAPLAAVEVVNPSMQPTLDAAALMAMNQRHQITDCIVEGPLALDNAISQEAALHKGIESEYAGKADILLVPNIEAGNMLYKSFVYFAKAKVGAVIEGAKAPIVLTSRADSAESKLFSLALAIQTANSAF